MYWQASRPKIWFSANSNLPRRDSKVLAGAPPSEIMEAMLDASSALRDLVLHTLKTPGRESAREISTPNALA